MAAKSQSKSSSALLVFLLVLITFPFWIGLFGLAIGTVGAIFGSVFGAIFGTLGHLLGAFFSMITWPIRAIFGGGSWFPHVNGYTVAVIVILIVLISKSKNKG